MSCELLNRGIAAICDSLNGAGGVDERVYVGNIDDIDPNLLTFGTNGEITGFGLLPGKFLYQFVSKQYKNTGSNEFQPAENGPKIWKHKVDLVHYIFPQEDIETLENLSKSDKLFSFLETNKEQIKCYGISRTGYQKFGLTVETQVGQEGVALGDDTTDKTTLSGMIKNKPMLYATEVSLDLMIAELDGMSASNS